MGEYFETKHDYMKAEVSNYTKKLTKKLCQGISLSRRDRILEIGCGRGRFSIPLLMSGINMTCVDTSKRLVQDFKKLMKDRKFEIKVKVTILNKDFYKLTGKFDKVIGFYILHHLGDMQKGINKIYDLLKSRGKIGFIEPNPYHPLWYLAPLFKEYRHIKNKEEKYFQVNKWKINEVFTNANFSNIKIEKFGFLPPQLLNTGIGSTLDKYSGKLIPRLYQLITAEKLA